MSKISIVDNAYTHVTRHKEPDERWDADDLDSDHNIVGFEFAPKGKNSYCDIETPFKVDPYKDYYLLYVIYSTGDSFHQESGLIEFINLFEDVNIAYENKRRIDEHYKKNKRTNSEDTYSVKLLSSIGNEYKINIPWMGYFESLDECEVKLVNLVV